MSFNTSGNRASNAGDGSTVAFTFPYLFYDASHLLVILVDSSGNETTQVITTDYTVTGVGASAGGTVTMVTPPAVGETLVILRIVPLTQGLALVENDPFPSQSVMEALDLNVMMTQQLSEYFDRTLRVSEGEDNFPELPSIADRASKYFAWDVNGDPIASAGALGTIPVSVFMEAVLGSANAAALITNGGFGDLAAADLVTLALMDDLAQGSIIVGGASDRPAALALGDGQVAIGDGTDVVAADLGAVIVDFDNTDSGLAATDVQEAIDEAILGGTIKSLAAQTGSGSETEFDFTIPSWAKRITLTFADVVRDTTATVFLQLGDAGGIETTDYKGAMVRAATSSTAMVQFSTAFQISGVEAAGAIMHGVMTLIKHDGNVWALEGTLSQSGGLVLCTSSGTKELSAALTTVRFTTSTGTAVFATGSSVAVKYE